MDKSKGSNNEEGLKRRASDYPTVGQRVWKYSKYALALLSLSASAYLTYLGTETPKPINMNVVPLTQDVGQSVFLTVPLGFMLDKNFYINSSTVRLDGSTMLSTPYLWMNTNKGSSYSVFTYSGLPIGDYNIIINLKYNINALKAVHQSFTLATLQVKEPLTCPTLPAEAQPVIVKPVRENENEDSSKSTSPICTWPIKR